MRFHIFETRGQKVACALTDADYARACEPSTPPFAIISPRSVERIDGVFELSVQTWLDENMICFTPQYAYIANLQVGPIPAYGLTFKDDDALALFMLRWG